jgi:spermidine synthase
MMIYGSAIALSAFLLFLVQPIIAKQILPWFGGSAAVWTTCMVFFQCALLAGYFYSDWLVRRMTIKRQVLIHSTLLLISLVVLPIVPAESFKPDDAANPIGKILLLLLVTIGLPYFMLSTTGPLIQAWFTKRFAQAKVYRLYAISNIFSMLALLAYPPLIEPNSASVQQSWGWSLGYVGFVVLTVLCAWLSYKKAGDHIELTQPVIGDTTSGVGPSTALQLGWLGLAALGSMALLTVTTHITQNVASVPFLWVAPLAVYLITFILCFDGRSWYLRNWYLPLSCLLVLLMMGGLSHKLGDNWIPEPGLLHFEHAVPLYCLGLFVLCMFVHGELVEHKPAPGHLTRFYLMVSLGGATGGLLVGVAAPLLLNWTWELPTMLLAFVLVAAWIGKDVQRTIAGFAVAGAVGLGIQYVSSVLEDTVSLTRNFYGTLRIKATASDDQESARWRLLHGVITHGEQFRNPQFKRLATTYYGGESGIGVALQSLETLRPQQAHKVGLVGLGVGTLAAYGEPNDTYRVYELNPAVVDMAYQQFSYLTDSKAKVIADLGDARLVLEKQSPQQFDVLAVDAFSSDSIPVHLMTHEAMQVYLKHLAPEGMLAFHISNRYLDLTGVVRQLADASGLQTFRFVHDPPERSFLYRSDWVILTRSARVAQHLKDTGKTTEIAPREQTHPGARLWTDQFNNLFEILK